MVPLVGSNFILCFNKYFLLSNICDKNNKKHFYSRYTSLSLAKTVHSAVASLLLQKCLLYPTWAETSIIYRTKLGECPMVLMYCSFILCIAIYLNNISYGSFIDHICTAHCPSAL